MVGGDGGGGCCGDGGGGTRAPQRRGSRHSCVDGPCGSSSGAAHTHTYTARAYAFFSVADAISCSCSCRGDEVPPPQLTDKCDPARADAVAARVARDRHRRPRSHCAARDPARPSLVMLSSSRSRRRSSGVIRQ